MNATVPADTPRGPSRRTSTAATATATKTASASHGYGPVTVARATPAAPAGASSAMDSACAPGSVSRTAIDAVIASTTPGTAVVTGAPIRLTRP